MSEDYIEALEARVTRIRELNDALRTCAGGGTWMITRGIAALPVPTQNAILAAVQRFEAFDEGNDPYREHDFGKVEIDGVAAFWKIDAYGRDVGPEDELSDPGTWSRVLTVMLAEEY